MIQKFSKKMFSLKIPNNLEVYFKLSHNSTSIEDLLPKKFESNFGGNYLQKPNMIQKLVVSKNLIESTNKGILNPCWDLFERGGKKWRYAFGLMVGKFLKVDLADSSKSLNLHRLSGLTEILHGGSLIIDDIEDKSEYRRFKKCVHLIHGKSCNNSCSLIYFRRKYINKRRNNSLFPTNSKVN